MVRRLNSARSGFRTLMGKTTSALDDTANPPADLVSIDKRWEKPEFWLAIADALSPYTDRNLLAAVDFGRNAAGEIEHLPPDQSVNSVILARGVVTLSFSGRKGQGLVDIQAKQAAIFHASKASRRW
jgi:putative spermidine/putrescine transport system permease protein